MAYRVHVAPVVNRAGYVFEILQFENQLWWPICLSNYASAPAENSAAKCLAELATDGPVPSALFPEGEKRKAGGFGDDRYCRTSGLKPIEAFPMRSIEWTRHDESLGTGQRLISENLILYGDGAYVWGGHPVYFQSERRPALDVTVVSVARDRSARHPGQLPTHFADDESFRTGHDNGKFWFPEQVKNVEDEACRTGSPLPRIETVIKPIGRLSCAEIRLDALFRAACLSFGSNSLRNLVAGGAVLSVLRTIALDMEEVANREIDETT